MNVNSSSFIKAVIFSIILTVIVVFYYTFYVDKFYDNNLSTIFIFLLFIMFCGTIYWIYHELEYNKRKWKGEKRPWYSWLWWPSRKWGEAYYWGAIIRVTIMVPFLIYFWLTFIYGYSNTIGLVFAIVSFLIIIFGITELHRWWENRNQLADEVIIYPRKTNRGFLMVLFIILITLIIYLPNLEQPKGNLQTYTMEQGFIGYWQNSEITLTINEDYSCYATYNNSTYSGRWSLNRFFGYIEIFWFQELKLPHPNDKSLLYPIEQIFLINSGSSLSLYTPFDAPEYLTLEKVTE